MANNYVESSFSIELLNNSEIAWWKKEGLRECPEDVFPEDMEVVISNDWEQDENKIWFHGDNECLEVDCAAEVIQRFLKECRQDGCIGFTWAETCSKPRLDEFGGGSCFITAKKMEWNNSHSWLDDNKKAFDRWGQDWVKEMAKQRVRNL